MNEKNNGIFRKSNLDRISSPERLDDYIKVTKPGVWVFLIAVAILLAAVLYWGVTFELTADGLRPIDFLLN